MNKEALIEMLMNQHRTLISDLILVLKKSSDDSKENKEDIIFDLKRFKNDLLDHMKTEAELFYPVYLENKIARKEDISDAKKFIGEMDSIGVFMIEFIDGYSVAGVIKKNHSKFEAELLTVIEKLKMRIESEEDGVFDVFMSM